MTEGIYILANDVVFDQLVALLNSLEVNAGKNYPVSIIPYDDRLERVESWLGSEGGQDETSDITERDPPDE